MNLNISEKDYSVQFLWIFKSILGSVIVVIIFGVMWVSGCGTQRTDSYLVVATISIPCSFIYIFLRRANFRYLTEDKYLSLYQGILSKQQRHIPYGVIQNILVKQDLFDRLFGLASLVIEDASQGAGAKEETTKIFGMKINAQSKGRHEAVGFSGNKVSIPGLAKADAEALKNIILNKMKENPVEDNQSGL